MPEPELNPGRSQLPWLLVLWLVTSLAAPVAGAQPSAIPVVVAVDTSRSLTAADLNAVRQTVRQTLEQLPPATRVGLIAFNDEPTWLVAAGSTAAEVVQALPQLRLEGDYTVLHDALFVAARELANGGVILLASDGRDERSATTVEDVERLCSANQVRIVSAGLGRRIDDRALRRLAMLTDGAFVDRLGDAGPALTRALSAAESQPAVTAPVQKPPPAAEQPPSPAAAGDTSEPGAAPESDRPAWLLPVLAAAGVLALGLVVLLVRRRRGERHRRCEQCGGTIEEWEETCPVCEIRALEEATGTQPVARHAASGDQDEALMDPKIFNKEPLPPGLEKTLVLDERPVAIVREPGKPPRSYNLPADKVFAVGRAPEVNTLQVSDPTVSAQHFKLVHKDGEFYVVDLHTTNGTTVNRQRIRVRKLKPGDIIGAGALDVEFNISVTRRT
jgi:hypothetical protein